MTEEVDYVKRADGTALVKIYPPEERKQEWIEQAEKEDKSLSKYLQELIVEAHAFRRQGFISVERQDAHLEELQEEIGQLEKRLQAKKAESSAAVSFEPYELKNKFLTDNYQTLEDILRKIVEEGHLDDLLRQPVENQLYFLAQQGEIQFERGWGWKLAEDNGGER